MPKTHCKHGHEFTEENTYIRPDNKARVCRICVKLRSRKYSKANPEKRRKSQEKWAKENPGLASIRSIKWNDNHPERTRTIHQKYYMNNQEECRKRNEKWNKENTDKCKTYSRRRRACKLQQMGEWPIPEATFIAELLETHPFCYYCQEPLGDGYHIEHMIPLSRGGLHDYRNVVLSCPPCNMRKGTKTAKEFKELL